MRIEEFKIERPGLVDIGDRVDIVERSTVAFYYYLVLPATAMSGNYSYSERIKSTSGIVKDIVKNDKGSYLEIEFEE